MPRITRKGQVTLPKRIREALGLRQGDIVDFKIAPDKRVVIVKGGSPSPFDKYFGFLKDKKGMDVDEIIREIRGE